MQHRNKLVNGRKWITCDEFIVYITKNIYDKEILEFCKQRWIIVSRIKTHKNKSGT